jgi:predicted AlkP superfamily pyrophosphatase or phosphodiesterase
LAPYYVDEERTSQTPWAFARDESYFDMAINLMQSRPVDVMAAYFQGVDVASHDFTEYAFGPNVNERRETRIPREEFAAGLSRIHAMYERMDTLVGGLLTRTGKDTDVIIVSDHGWEYDGTSHWNLNPGFFLGAGPSFRSGQRIASISVLDVLPLLLVVSNVPVPRDLDGAIPNQILQPSVVARARFIDHYPGEPLMLEAGTKGDSADDESLVQRLRALGYVP